MTLSKDHKFITSIPCNGYNLLLRDHDWGIAERRIPIIAFLIYETSDGAEGILHRTYPATATTVYHGDEKQRWVIGLPDGRIGTMMGLFDNLEQYKNEVLFMRPGY